MISNLQALRAIAALLVVFFHITGTSASYGQATHYLHFLNGWGAFGVDIFFVLSGFVMYYTQYGKPKTPVQFFKNRIVRIVPLYWFLTFIALAMYYLMPDMMKGGLNASIDRLLISLFFVSRKLTGVGPILGSGWTLEYEFLFYSFFAISLLSKNLKYACIMSGTCLFMLALLSISNWLVLEFVGGMLCAYLYLSNSPILPYAKPALFVGVLALIATLFYAKHGISRVIVWGIPSVPIVLGSCLFKQTKNRLLIFLGNASYSIYLMQVFTITAFYKFTSHFLPSAQTDVLAIGCLISTAIAGSIVYVGIEMPLTKLCKRLMNRNKRRANSLQNTGQQVETA